MMLRCTDGCGFESCRARESFNYLTISSDGQRRRNWESSRSSLANLSVRQRKGGPFSSSASGYQSEPFRDLRDASCLPLGSRLGGPPDRPGAAILVRSVQGTGRKEAELRPENPCRWAEE